MAKEYKTTPEQRQYAYDWHTKKAIWEQIDKAWDRADALVDALTKLEDVVEKRLGQRPNSKKRRS